MKATRGSLAKGFASGSVTSPNRRAWETTDQDEESVQDAPTIALRIFQMKMTLFKKLENTPIVDLSELNSIRRFVIS